MEGNNVFQAFYRSFYDKRFYQDVAVRWTGSGFLLLFAMFLFYALVQGIDAYVTMQMYLKKDGQKIVSQLPSFTYQDGTFSMDRTGPVIIKDAEGKRTFAVLDPEHKIKSLKEADTIFLVTDKQIIYADEGGEKHEKLSQLDVLIKNFSGNAESVMKLLNQGSVLVSGALFAGTLVGGFLSDLIRILILAAVIGFFSTERTFTSRTRLLVCAAIPPHVISAFLGILSLTPPVADGLISAIAFTIYAVLAFKWTRPEPQVQIAG
jgi:hypothetical protein